MLINGSVKRQFVTVDNLLQATICNNNSAQYSSRAGCKRNGAKWSKRILLKPMPRYEMPPVTSCRLLRIVALPKGSTILTSTIEQKLI